jgi:hypothetical protein
MGDSSFYTDLNCGQHMVNPLRWGGGEGCECGSEACMAWPGLAPCGR